MELQVGSILEGKVTSITKFGAFVALDNGKSGLVHISEIANSFVNDVHDFLELFFPRVCLWVKGFRCSTVLDELLSLHFHAGIVDAVEGLLQSVNFVLGCTGHIIGYFFEPVENFLLGWFLCRFDRFFFCCLIVRRDHCTCLVVSRLNGVFAFF